MRHDVILTSPSPTMHSSIRGSPCPVLVAYLPALNALSLPLRIISPITLFRTCTSMSCDLWSCHHVLWLVFFFPLMFMLSQRRDLAKPLQPLRPITNDESGFSFHLPYLTLLFLKVMTVVVLERGRFKKARFCVQEQ